MDLLQYLEKAYNDCSNPCFFADYETEEIVYINQAMGKKFQVFEGYEGKKASDLLDQYVEPSNVTPKEKIQVGIFYEQRIFSKVLNMYLRENTTLLDICGRKLIATKFFLTSLDKNKAEAVHTFESAMTKCLEILSFSEQSASITAFMKLLCEFYDCELSYICEFDEAQTTLASKYFWSTAEGEVDIPLNRKDTVSMDQFVTWLKNDRNHEIIHIDTSTPLALASKTELEILNSYGISNVTLNKLWNKDGTLLGIVGMSNCGQLMYDDRLLKAVSHFVVERFNEASMVKALDSLHEIDLLTGFYNRSKYAEKLRELHEKTPEKLGVLFINLNGLRKTNEYFGFEVGDVQIKKTTRLLREFFTEDFYRISGDEFVGFMPNWEKDTFEKKVDELQTQLKNDQHEANFSLGHSWDQGNYNVGNLVKIADTVMIINKQTYYSESLKNSEEVTNTVLQDLFRGIAEDEFMVYLQPQIDLNTEQVVGAEALIRRYDKKHQKMIFPDNFIPLYEKNSIIRHIDLFVVRRVCQLLVEWGHFDKSLPVSVNLSRVTLMEHGIVSTVSDILDEYSVPHHLIIIEVTERIGLIENDVASSLVDEFKSRGFRLSLDDFGCAYSNIVTLATISVDEVKIDKSLVDHVLTNQKNSVIVKNMLAMCHELEGTQTLAEGIETKEQADFLRSVFCHLGQGYLYSRPIPSNEFFERYIKPIALS